MAALNPKAIKPITFFAQGHAPDIRLHVLDRGVYHVHSVILKLNSNFFFKSLDSPDKAASIPIAGNFKYELFTKVDDDGTWNLVAATIENQGIEKFKGELEIHSLAFGNLITVMHGKEYRVSNVEQLSILTQLADYYWTLPVVSKTLSLALKAGFLLDFTEKAVALFGITLKLRHQELFTDCVLHLAGRRREFMNSWIDDIPDGDSVLYEIVKLASLRVDSLVVTTFSTLMKLGEGTSAIKEKLTRVTGFSSLPEYFYMLQEWNWHDVIIDLHVNEVIQGFLTKKVRFNLHKLPPVGEGELVDTFLCSWIEENDIPWDTTQEDW